jgi:uracil-DNA glycosylase family 4
VLGEQPSADDVKVGVPFQGYVGEELDKGLGGNRRDVYATNIRKCNGSDGESSSLREASIAFCTNEYLSAEFAAHAEVRVLLAVGADALEVVVGRRDITKVHGSTYSRSEVEKMRNVEIRS